jgi:hypothetical protein
VLGDLSRTSAGRPARTTRRTWGRWLALTLGPVALLAASLRAADEQTAAGFAFPAPVLRELADVRRLTGCLGAPTDDSGQETAFRGRPSLEIKGRERAGDASGTMRDLADFDLAAGRIVSYVCFAHASTRVSGEAIVSLAEISSRADRQARALLPGSKLELESIKRHRAGGTESIYYEARYASASGEFPFLEPPVRLLLNATTGNLFRLDIDPDWLDPAAAPRVRISRKAAQRIATVVLRRHDLAPAFGTSAVFGAVAAAEVYTVHPNDWLGMYTGNAGARAAWVVPFRVDGGDAPGLHSLFVDAATGLVLGGLSGHMAGHPPR